jgi:aldehyde:ferredoxin oxidoreductase
MGAVMGSKNLKAIVVRGKQRPKVADSKGLNQLARCGAKEFPASDVYGLGLLGTAEVLGPQNRDGGLPTRNWYSGTFEGWKPIDGKTMEKTILKERDTCYACTVRCKRVVEITEGPYIVDPRYGGPEYETLSTFGSYCGIDDLAAISYANQLCNMYGMDTISCGATIAWAMDCFEQGLITTKDTGGITLRFGDAAVMVQIVEAIAQRQGFGDLLAEGSARAADRIGRGTQDLVVAVKKQEMPAHMPQVKRSLGLIYAVNPYGADHQSHEHDPSYADYPERMAEIGLTDPQPDDVLNQEKVRYALITEYLYSALDTVNMCQFVFGPAWQLYSAEHLVEVMRLVTGQDFSTDDVLQLGERRLNLLRAFNARESIGREADRLPKKMYQALTGGASDGIVLTEKEIEDAKDIYYQMAGWDVASGTPTRTKLEELELGWVADLLQV